ncbi:MAG: DUF5694 domain-containing protein [Planctomycetota bacterium]|jgi:hypothetical protein
MRQITYGFLSSLLGFASSGMAQDPLDLLVSLEEVEQPTQVLVLGTPHLSVLGDRFQPSALDSLIELLAAWNPSAVAVESLTPAQVASMTVEGVEFESVVERFAGRRTRLASAAQDFLGQTREEAGAELRSKAKDFAGDLDPEKRSSLIMLCLAALDLDSAVLQWSYLSISEREGALLPETVIAGLNRRLDSANETVSIATRLARQLGQQRIWASDDHWDKRSFAGFGNSFGTELEQSAAYAKLQEETFYADSDAHMRAQLAEGDLLPHYLRINSPEHCARDVELQWGLFLRTDLPSKLDRARLHLWQARNLRMTAHVAEVAAHFPGGRVLVLVGAAHKPFLDAMLARNTGELQVRHLSELQD